MGVWCGSVRSFPAMKYKQIPRYGLALVLSVSSLAALQVLTDKNGIIFFCRETQMGDNVVIPLQLHWGLALTQKTLLSSLLAALNAAFINKKFKLDIIMHITWKLMVNILKLVLLYC